MSDAQVILDVDVHDKPGLCRAICDHEDGRWSIITAPPKGPATTVEQTYTLDAARDWAIKVLAGDPDVRTRKGLGPMLAAALLTMMVANGAISTEKPK